MVEMEADMARPPTRPTPAPRRTSRHNLWPESLELPSVVSPSWWQTFLNYSRSSHVSQTEQQDYLRFLFNKNYMNYKFLILKENI